MLLVLIARAFLFELEGVSVHKKHIYNAPKKLRLKNLKLRLIIDITNKGRRNIIASCVMHSALKSEHVSKTAEALQGSIGAHESVEVDGVGEVGEVGGVGEVGEIGEVGGKCVGGVGGGRLGRASELTSAHILAHRGCSASTSTWRMPRLVEGASPRYYLLASSGRA